MPTCKNDPIKSYKGNEPSPKGLGYCAHAEKIGKIKKGKDGNKWKIETTLKGVKRWIKQNTIKKTVIPTKKKIKYKTYLIYTGYNGDMGFTPVNFIIKINNKHCLIYEIPKNFYKNISSNDVESPSFEKKLNKKHQNFITKQNKPKLEFNFDKVFITKGIEQVLNSIKDDIYYNPKLNGNNLLFKVNNDYIFVGHEVYKFNTENDEILDFYSSVELYDNRYCPMAYSKEYAYFLLNKKKVPLEKIHHLTLKDKINPIYYYSVSSYTKNKSKEIQNQEKIKKGKLSGHPLIKISKPIKILKIL